jgi:hypothetical protein
VFVVSCLLALPRRCGAAKQETDMSKKLLRSLMLAFAAYALAAGCVTATTAVANAAVFPSGPAR